MGTVLTVLNCSCCAASALSACCCRSSGKTATSEASARIFYMLLVIFGGLLAFVLNSYNSSLSGWLSQATFGCAEEDVSMDMCFGTQAIYRVLFALTVFFLLCTLLSWGEQVYREFWGLKIFLIIGFVVIAFILPASVLTAYAQVARVVSILFLIFMALTLIDFAYQLQDVLLEKAEKRHTELQVDHDEVGICQNQWSILYILICMALILGGLIGMGFMYDFASNRPGGSSCPTDLAFLSITLICAVVYMILSPLECLDPAGGSKGQLAPSVIFCYCVWVCYSAISNNPNEMCNPSPNSSSGIVVTGGVIFTLIAVLYQGYSASNWINNLLARRDEGAAAQSRALEEEEESLRDERHALLNDMCTEEMTVDDAAQRHMELSSRSPSHTASTPYSASLTKDELQAVSSHRTRARAVYVLMLAVTCMFLSMCLTGWQMEPGVCIRLTPFNRVKQHTNTTMFINISSQWVAVLLYIWTLIAPRVCPHRDFS